MIENLPCIIQSQDGHLRVFLFLRAKVSYWNKKLICGKYGRF